MYEFVRGPMMWISFVVCITGLIYQAIQLMRITRKRESVYYTSEDKDKEKEKDLKVILKEKISFPSLLEMRIALKGSVLGNQPVIAVLTSVFHVCILITPLFLMGHNVLLFESWGVNLCSFSECTTDLMTIALLVCGLLFFLRRIFVSRVRAVTSVYDYILLFITIAPFLTGFLAYHQLVDYESIIIAHILLGELMLISMGITKLSHMIFFFFARFLIGSEYSFRDGSRTWY